MIRTITLALIIALASAATLATASTETDVVKDVSLDKKEFQAVKLAYKWTSNPELPVMKENGKIVYLFGATLPTVVCSPLHSCDLALQPGETIRPNGLHLGDKVRWEVTPAISGSGSNMVSHVVIKPRDIGLVTTLNIFTDRRVYHVLLKSRKQNWMPFIGFAYPDEINQKWEEYYAKTEKTRQQKTIPETKENINDLDFAYSVKGDASWKPVRVYNNGTKTIIQMPDVMKSREAPVLLVLGESGGQQLVNYRLKDNRYIVDQLFDSAVLIAGVGSKQSKITISRESK